MKFYKEGNLLTYMLSTGMEEIEALRFAEGILSALKYCHYLKIAHRDLKPNNILISDDITPILCDFGTAKKCEAYREEQRSNLYNQPIMEYLAPEVKGKSSVNWFKVDMWSVGVIIYKMIEGKSPFKDTDNEKDRYFPHIKKICDQTKQLIAGLLEVNVKNRLSASQAYEKVKKIIKSIEQKKQIKK